MGEGERERGRGGGERERGREMVIWTRGDFIKCLNPSFETNIFSDTDCLM